MPDRGLHLIAERQHVAEQARLKNIPQRDVVVLEVRLAALEEALHRAERLNEKRC